MSWWNRRAAADPAVDRAQEFEIRDDMLDAYKLVYALADHLNTRWHDLAGIVKDDPGAASKLAEIDAVREAFAEQVRATRERHIATRPAEWQLLYSTGALDLLRMLEAQLNRPNSLLGYRR